MRPIQEFRGTVHADVAVAGDRLGGGPVGQMMQEERVTLVTTIRFGAERYLESKCKQPTWGRDV